MNIRLTIPEKILIHLYSYRKFSDRYEYPIEMTQQGIAAAVGISVTHVPRNIKKLQAEHLVEVRKGHVPGKKKRVTIYFLTSHGIMRARDIIEKIEKTEVSLGEKVYSMSELKKLTNLSLLELIRKIEKGELTEDSLFLPERKLVFKEIEVTTDLFVDREKELKQMQHWYSFGKILVILGSRGVGKSALIQRFLEIQNPKRSIVWLNIYPQRTWKTIRDIFLHLFELDDVLRVMKNHPLLLILDNYYDVDDTFVSALSSLVKEDLGKSKIIVSMRADTPFYNRFYSLSDVVEGRVEEIRLEPLKYEDARKLLPDVKESAFKSIYKITRGNPKILVMLRKGEIKDYDDIPLPPEQIHLLNYLASQKIKNFKSH